MTSEPATSEPSSPRSEWLAIARLKAVFGPQAPLGMWPVEVGIGDDAAVVSVGTTHLVACVDQMVEGTHFLTSLTTLADAGWKAMARNISDIAAMGAAPRFALCSMAVPPGRGGDVDEIVGGLAAAAAEWSCPVIGGDLASGATLVISVTVMGELTGGGPPLRRSGAVAGDLVYVAGPLGRGGAGYHRLRDATPSSSAECEGWYARPRPSIAAGVAARRGGASAAIDVSDGLVQDLGHLGDASGVGFVIDASAVPIGDGASRLEALTCGDDYVLVLAVPPSAERTIEAEFGAVGLDPPTLIGQFVPDATLRHVADAPAGLGAGLGWSHPL